MFRSVGGLSAAFVFLALALFSPAAFAQPVVPVCSTIDPAFGPPGSTVTLRGSGFDGISAQVTFNGLAGEVLAVTDKRIDVRTPDAVTTGPVVATIGYDPAVETDPDVVLRDSFEDPAAGRIEMATCGDFRLNRAPVLGALSNVSVEVGQTLDFTVTASDPDGDPITLAVNPLPLPDDATFTIANGRFYFRPGLAVVGEHELTFIVTDGQLFDRQTITVTVNPPPGTTSLAGVVLTLEDAPLEGVRLVWGVEAPVEAFSGPDGRFLLENLPVAGRQRLLIDGSTVPGPPSGTYATVPEQIHVYEGAANVMEHAIHLLPLDLAAADPIDPAVPSELTSSPIEIEGVTFDPIKITVPAGSAVLDDGSFFDGSVHISNISDPSLGPLPLPPDIDLGLYFAIQPFGVHYDIPAPIEVPNVEGFVVGSVVDFIALNHDTGFMEKIGDGIVDPDNMIRSGTLNADGSFTYGGIVVDNSWHGFVPAPAIDSPNNAGGPSPGGLNPSPPRTCVGSTACRQTGDLDATHELVSYRSMDVSRALTMTYHSQHAAPHPFMSRGWTPGNLSPAPIFMSTTMSLGGLKLGDEIYHKGPTCFGLGCPAGVFNRVLDASAFDTGVYAGELRLSCQFPRSRRDESYFTNLQVINQIDSPFGAGWSLMGLERIHVSQTGDLLLTDGEEIGAVYSPAKRARAAISAPGQQDDYRVALDIGEFITVRMRRRSNQPDGSSTLDPVIEVYNSAGILLTRDDNGGVDLVDGPNSNAAILAFPVPATDTYIIRARGALGTQGPYDLLLTTASEADLAAGRINAADTVEPVFNFSGDIATGGELDDHNFAATAGTEVTVYVNRVANQPDDTGSLDPAVNIYNSSNVLLFSDLDGGTDAPPGPGWNAAVIRQTLPADDTYRIEVAGQNATTGPYAVEVIFGNLVGNAAVENDAVELGEEILAPPGAFTTLDVHEAGYTRRDKFGTVTQYDIEGRIVSMADRNENTTVYDYDGFGRLTSITDPVGLVTELFYEDAATLGTCTGRVREIVDPAGRSTLFEHDNACNLVAIIDPDGARREFEYDENHLLVAQTRQRGTVTADPTDFRTKYELDFSGRFISSIQPDGVVNEFLPIQRIGLIEPPQNCDANPEPGCPNMLADVPGFAALVPYSRSGCGRVSSGSASSQKAGAPIACRETIEWRWEGLDINGYPAGTTYPDGSSSSEDRDSQGLLKSLTDERGFVSNFAYDDRGNLTELSQADSGFSVSLTYEPQFSNLLSLMDANGNEYQFTYDEKGNLIALLDPRGFSTSWSYNGRGQVLSQTDALGQTLILNYDPGTFNLVSVEFPEGISELFTRDDAGNVLTYRDGMQQVSAMQYDPMNRIINFTNGKGGISSVEYDESGNRTRVTDENGNESVFEYDSMNRLSSRVDAVGRTESFVYDPQSNLVEFITRAGQSVFYEYDRRDRLTRKSLPDGSEHVYTYDEAGNLQTASNQDSLLEFDYDPLGRIVSERQVNLNVAGADFSATMTYDANGNRLTRQTDVGETTYVYDELNRPESIITPEASKIDFVYDPINRLSAVHFPNGISTTYEFDTSSRVTAVAHNQGAVLVSAFTHLYDDNSNRTQTQQVRPGLPVNPTLDFAYDELDQLTSATRQLGIGDEVFVYDDVGNRLRRDGEIEDALFDANNSIEQNEFFTFSHDGNGNLILRQDRLSGEVERFEYDAENRLIAYSRHPDSQAPAASTASYAYDALDRRISKTVDGVTTAWVLDDEDIEFEYADDLTITASFVRGLAVDQHLLMRRDGEVFSFQTDALGNVISLANQDGDVVQHYVYDAFGEMTVFDSTGGILAPGQEIQNAFTYTGREHDVESGNFYYRARYFDPGTGRFMSEDPLGFGGGDLNVYRYVGNNSLNWIDPLGQSKLVAAILTAGVVGAGCYIYTNDKPNAKDAGANITRSISGNRLPGADTALDPDNAKDLVNGVLNAHDKAGQTNKRLENAGEEGLATSENFILKKWNSMWGGNNQGTGKGGGGKSCSKTPKKKNNNNPSNNSCGQ